MEIPSSCFLACNLLHLSLHEVLKKIKKSFVAALVTKKTRMDDFAALGKKVVEEQGKLKGNIVRIVAGSNKSSLWPAHGSYQSCQRKDYGSELQQEEPLRFHVCKCSNQHDR